MTAKRAHPSDIVAAKLFYAAERLGGVLYERFAAGLDHDDVAHAIGAMAGDEGMHATWYEAWLEERGAKAPSLEVSGRVIVPTLNRLLAPRSLDAQLRAFAKTESTAIGHLDALMARIRDPELKAIVERTLPFERAHAEWYRRDGRRMLRPQDFRRR